MARIVAFAANEINLRVCVLCRSVNVRDSIDDVAVTGCSLEEHDRNLKRLLDDASNCNTP